MYNDILTFAKGKCKIFQLNPLMKPTSNQAIQTALTGNWVEAIKLNKLLLAENPDDAEALNRMGLAYTILGKNKSARDTYQKVLEIDPLNSIAIKNLRKIKTDGPKDSEETVIILVNNIFLEETGKTKVVDLVNLAQPQVLTTLRTGQLLDLAAKRLKIFISLGKDYIGVLPDDIGKRLIKFIKGGNKYEAFVKSATQQNVTIFIKEVKRAAKFKDQPSFIYIVEKKLSIKKGAKGKISREKDYEEDSLSDEE
ncbi:MAG: tetratricopeptide repeat protein [Patescibacteria group bacterium]